MNSNQSPQLFNPKVSVIIPVYNGSDFLADAIASVLAQTYHNIEIIVVNDGSDDNGATETIAKSYGNCIRYFAKPNGGVASALNLAIKKMSGDYFSWLSHDDLYCNEKIATQVNALVMTGSERTILYSDYSVFTESPDKAVQVKMPAIPPAHFRYWITTQSALHGCTLLIPRSALEEYGGFNEDLRTTQDYDLWFKLAEKYQFVHIPEVLVKARSHAGQGSMRMASVAFKESNELLTKFVGNLTVEELTSATGLAIGSAYLMIAVSMWSRKFREAATCARQLARQYGVTQLYIYRAMTLAYLKVFFIQFVRLLLTPHSRLKLRHYWGLFASFKPS